MCCNGSSTHFLFASKPGRDTKAYVKNRNNDFCFFNRIEETASPFKLQVGDEEWQGRRATAFR